MTGFDVALLVLAGVAALVGFLKGMVRLLIGLAAVIAAFILAARCHEALAPRLEFITSVESARRGIAYVAILLGTLVAGAIAGWLARKMLSVVGLGLIDRLAGAVLGLATALALAAFAVLPLVTYWSAGRQMLERSTLAPYVTVVADLANSLMPEETARSYRQHIEVLRDHWRGLAP